MKKSFLLLTTIAVFALNSFAQQWEVLRHSSPVAAPARTSSANSFEYGYSTDNIVSSLGYDAGATVRVAFVIPKNVAATYAGAQITKIHVGFGSSPATNTSVFIAESLSSTLAYSQSANFGINQWNVVNLTTPYTITGTTDVVIGYEFKGGGTGAFYSIGLDDSDAPNANSNYFAVKTGLSYPIWENLADYGYYNVTLKATIQGDNLPQYDVSVNSVTTSALDVAPDETFSILTAVTNQATQTITSLKLSYEVGETVLTEVVSGIAIAPLKSYSLSKDVSLNTEGVYPVKVTVLELNGDNDDENPSNNSLLASQTLWVGNSAPTIPRNRNVVLEEYTGIYCVYCPDGHKKANELKASNPGQVEIINIHQGYYANPSAGDPDYRTSWGDALAAQTGLKGYPSGTVNRHVFTNNDTTALNRGDWANAARLIINEVSPVNLRAKASVDWTTNTLTVDVSGYYTGNSANATNLLNVALLQENILGPQTGGINFYPEMLTEDGLYRHNHMLRDLLTGQWGDTIFVTTQGTSFSKQYTYTIPEHYKNIVVDLNNLTILAFIAEGKQEIITGTRAKISSIHITEPTIKIVNIEQQSLPTADNNILAKVIVQNISQAPVTSYNLKYKVDDGESVSYSVTGKNIQLLEQDTLLLPLIPITLGEKHTLTVAADQTNGNTQTKASQLSIEVSKYVSFASSRSLSLKVWQDAYGSETTWALFDTDGTTIVTQGGPYSNLSAVGTQLHEENLTVPEDGVYRFEIYDEYGDGINAGYGEGKYEIWAGDELIVSSDGKFGSKDVKVISVTTVTSIKDISAPEISIYAFGDDLRIVSTLPVASVAVYDTLGKQLILQNNSNSLSLNNLNKGIYIVKVITLTGVEKTVKIIK
ncbi:MAG: Omp28-related outer membrane protein [Dysgonamonadaceae bacterium]|nr:Omp28-related outer membrane protein [Dysgonamonadaceae bacterium]